MAANPACQSFIPMLSPFIDGELVPSQRITVEQHLAACKECTMRAADLRAESGLVRVGMEMLADEVDFKDFAQKVMARVTPEKLPWTLRVKLTISEMFTYQRRVLITSMATAAVMIVAALPFVLRDRAPIGYASPRLTVQTVSIDESAHVAPVVMETASGDAIIWMIDDDHEKNQEQDVDLPSTDTEIEQDAPKGGEL